MINFTSTLSYGLRFLVNLALNGENAKKLSIIAKEENITLPYLRKLILPLERGGLVKSVKGPGGGFKLNREPFQIELLEVINALSRSKKIECVKSPSNCLRSEDCLVKDLWKEVSNTIEVVLKNKTLETLIKKHPSKK